MHRITHSLEIGFSWQFWHRRCCNSSLFWDKKGMAAFLVTTLVVWIILVFMMKKHGLPADRANWVRTYAWPSWFAGCIGIWYKLMPAYTAKIFLVSIFIFAITIKVLMVVAFWTANLIWFCHEDSSPFGRYSVCDKTIVPEGLTGLQLSFNFTIRLLY